MPTNHTHNPELRSWVDSANDAAADFPIQNLPLCAFMKSHDGHTHRHLGVAIGDHVLDVSMLLEAGAFGDDDLARAVSVGMWNGLASQPDLWLPFRERVQDFLKHDAAGGQSTRRLRQKALTTIAETRFLSGIAIFNYTDFYASKHHATNVGSMFRPDNPLLPNYKHVPIGYHGRASSLVVSGSDIRRPNGQQSPPEGDPKALPAFGPCKMLDYEMELGLFVGGGNALGTPISIADARRSMFGLCILNDWSARDLQKWEYQPLGPFLAKNFASTISPFIVTLDALEPFRIDGPSRDADDPAPLPYLHTSEPFGLDITVEVLLLTEQMRTKNLPPHSISTGNSKDLFWTFAQMLAHHTSNGCNLQPGDLLGSGTISGRDKNSRGCLLELTWDGIGSDGKPKPRSPVTLPSGETRTFLADGDEVIMRAWAEKPGFRGVGFGECRGKILPAKS